MYRTFFLLGFKCYCILLFFLVTKLYLYSVTLAYFLTSDSEFEFLKKFGNHTLL